MPPSEQPMSDVPPTEQPRSDVPPTEQPMSDVPPTEQPLTGGTANRGLVFRVGDAVRRPLRPSSPATHALLRHLSEVGFPAHPGSWASTTAAGRCSATSPAWRSLPVPWYERNRDVLRAALS